MRQQDIGRMLGGRGTVDALWPEGGVEVFDLFCGADG